MTSTGARTISADDWRCLARSAPWLWRSLLCTVTATEGTDVEGHRWLRVWTERRGRLHAVDRDGTVVRSESARRRSPVGGQVLLGDAPPGFMPAVYVDPEPGRGERRPGPVGTDGVARLLAAATRRADGLVVRREASGHDLQTPLIQSYFWPAVMDPREMADGFDPETGEDGPGCDLADLRVETRDGREQWGATVTPLAAYDPLCSCCPLLCGEQALTQMKHEGYQLDSTTGATRWSVWLDRGTGVITRLRELDGPDAGRGWDLVVEAVDQPCP